MNIVERLRGHVEKRGGPAKDENGRYVGTVWPLMLEAADEIERLRKIEAAATAWRRSLECDDWTVEAIESDACRPGMSALLKLIPSEKQTAKCPYYPGCQPDQCSRCWEHDHTANQQITNDE